MAVIQRFTIELPTDPFHDESDGWLLILSREETEQLAADLHEALGSVPAGLADDLARIEQKLDWLTAIDGRSDMDEGALTEVHGNPAEDVDEILARMQAMAAIGQPMPPGMSPQSGIGNLPS